ncbi:CHAP domain-containing protein [Companilactobacillus sp. DQM5]|uniref:CHAP domain-containing protein n=1 Tax=Companilactobacillus sp. DQM5 TaxID=3463359 RepID=UPI004059D909
MKKNILKKSIIGLSGVALLSVAANEVSAATEGVVSYTKGATTVWSSTDKGQKVKSYLGQGQKVSISSQKQVFGEKWYNLGNDNWVSAKYISTNGQQATTEQTQASSQKVTINYANGAVTLWTDANSGVATGNYVFNGQTKDVKSTKTVNGSVWYQLDNGWVPAEFVSTNGTSAQPAPAAPAANTQQAQPAAPAANNTQSNNAQPAAPATSAPSHPAYNGANTYPAGQCTWYVKNRASWVGNYWGNAANWANSARAAGFLVNGTPEVGSVAVFAPGVAYASAYGHVAYVESVNGNGTVTISEANFAGQSYHVRTVSIAGVQFIHR